jgi:transposase InsO family protein
VHPWRAELAKHGLKGSMGRRGNPYDNAKAESFMKTLKAGPPNVRCRGHFGSEMLSMSISESDASRTLGALTIGVAVSPPQRDVRSPTASRRPG